MAATVVATGQHPLDGAALARSVRTLADAGHDPVVVAPAGGDGAGGLALGIGPSRAGRRAVSVVAHVLIDPLDPALAQSAGPECAEPLAVLEAEAIAALVGAGFAVVVAEQRPVVPLGPSYEARPAALDPAAGAARLAGDLGSGVLIFVTGGDGPPWSGDVDVREAERHLAADASWAAELRAATRFLRAGGELAALTTPAGLLAAVSARPAGGAGILRIHRTLARPRSDSPVFTAGWC
jgi:hypothetical protein